MKNLLDAIAFAKRRHKGQVRKGSGDPYITHPVAVSYIVMAYKRSKHLQELLIAAILHDCLEDTNTTFAELSRRFSPFVASLVLELSNDQEQIALLGKYEYQARKLIGMSSYALVLKLADRLHNITDQPSPTMVADTLKMMRRLRKHRILSKTHQSLVAEIERQCRAAQREAT